MEKIKSLKGSVALHLILIALLGLIAYSNTFNVPFLFDDIENIVENPLVKDFSYFTDPSKAKTLGHYRNVFPLRKTRIIGYLTFWANYEIHELNVTGFHVVNLAIHIVNAVLVYFLVILTFRTPSLGTSILKKRSRHIGLFSALLFVSHPVQTQAVTYIVQRFTSLATMFYLMSLALYIIFRLRASRGLGSQPGSLLLYFSVLLCCIFAMKTKEIAFTLPVAIAVFEFMFFKETLRRRALYLSPLLLTMLIIPLSYMSLIGTGSPIEELIGDADYVTRSQDISRMGYLFTEFRVIVTYLRLLVLPINQNLYYDYQVFHSFLEPPVFLSFLFLLSIFGLGVYLFYRSRITDSGARLVAFGIFWFFITLSVESSIIPLHAIYEHRVYLPSAGAFSAFAVGAFLLIERFKTRKIKHIAISSTVLLLILLSYATYARNYIWQSEATLWEDVLQKSPRTARPHVILGNALMSEGEIDRAIEHFETAAKLEPDLAEVYNSLGCAYNSKGLVDKAIEYFRIAIKLKPDITEAHINLGVIYSSKGLTDKAIEHFQTVARLKPDYDDIYYNLGIAYGRKGLTDKAIEHYQTALRMNPNSADINYNLGVSYGRKGLIDKAIEHYQTALRMNPNSAKSHSNLGVAYESKGLIEKSIIHFQTAVRLKPDNASVHINLGNAYLAKGLADRAIEHYKKALKLKPDYAGAHFNIGLAYLRKGLADKARREFQTVLNIDPDFHEAQRRLDSIDNPDKARP